MHIFKIKNPETSDITNTFMQTGLRFERFNFSKFQLLTIFNLVHSLPYNDDCCFGYSLFVYLGVIMITCKYSNPYVRYLQIRGKVNQVRIKSTCKIKDDLEEITDVYDI